MPKGKTRNVLFGVQKQQLKHLSDTDRQTLYELCGWSKDLYNTTLYQIRQHYFREHVYLSYESNYQFCKNTNAYKQLNSGVAQQIMKVVDRNVKPFFVAIDLAKSGNIQYGMSRLPDYLKSDSFFSLIFSVVVIKDGFFTLPMSGLFKKNHDPISFLVPSNLLDKTIREIRVVPKNKATCFEVQYVYENFASDIICDKEYVLAIDLGVNNLITGVTNRGEAFIIDGHRLKSINAYTNRRNVELQKIKEKQGIVLTTPRQQLLWDKRYRIIVDGFNKAARMVVNYCFDRKIGKIIVGYHPSKWGTIVDDFSFIDLPIGLLRDKIGYLGKRQGIDVFEQEESYTSMADFLANDVVPEYKAFDNNSYAFSGERIARGLYQSSTGVLINADCNGALNILRKSGVSIMSFDNTEYLSPKRLLIK